MLKNYIVIALRHLKRQWTYSFINILGLAVGLACSLMIFLYVYGEWSYDRHFKNADRIYRIGVGFFNIGPFAVGPELLGDYLPKEFDGIEVFTRLKRSREEIIRVGEKTFKNEAYYTDSSFFKVFSYTFVEGNEKRALLHPFSVVLTESMARNYFQEENALGKAIEVGKERTPYVVTGIIQDPTHNSKFKTSVWLSLPVQQNTNLVWPSAGVYNYVLLKENVNEADLNNALDRMIEKHVYPSSGAKTEALQQNYVKNIAYKFMVHRLPDIYLKSSLTFDVSPGGNEANLYIFTIVALFILVLAMVNFVNLSTARAARRAKEVGVRKSLGTSRKNLVAQFLLESVLITLFSMILALGLAELFAFVFLWITGQHIAVSVWSSLVGIVGLVVFTLAIALLAGIYPAFYLTSFQPAKVLKGNVHSAGSQTFRNALVVFQFSIAIALIICSAIVLQQLRFISKKDLGFNAENVLTIDNMDVLKGSQQAFKDYLEQQAGVAGTSLHTVQPGSKSFVYARMYETPQLTNPISINTFIGDHDYLRLMGYTLLQGRDFDKNLTSDTSAVILNEAAVKALEITDNPLGVEVEKGVRVIGVVRDFHWESLRNVIAPVVLALGGNTRMGEYQQLAIKFNSRDASALIKAADTKWKTLVQEEPMAYHFLDDNFGALARKEEILGKAITFFTTLAIGISCLGLFGLAAHTTTQRTREIGIRKVFGASVPNIVILLNKQFTRLVLLAILLAVPASWYMAEQWLSEFAYHISLSPWVFLAGSLAGLAISYLTVGYHSLKASRANPSETLKCE